MSRFGGHADFTPVSEGVLDRHFKPELGSVNSVENLEIDKLIYYLFI